MPPVRRQLDGVLITPPPPSPRLGVPQLSGAASALPRARTEKPDDMAKPVAFKDIGKTCKGLSRSLRSRRVPAES